MSLHRPTGYVRAARLLASLLATLALVFAGLAPGALAQSATASDPLAGTWTTPPLTQAQIKSALDAAGLPADGIATFLANADWTDPIVWAVQFGDGHYLLKGSSGGGVLQTLDQNTYRIVDDHTYVLGNGPGEPTFDYAVSGDSLMLREVSEPTDTSGNWHYYATALFGVAPFQRMVQGPAPTSAPSPAPLTASPVPSAASSTGDWLMVRGDASRRAEGLDGPIGQPVLRWRYQAQGSTAGAVAVVGDLAYSASDDGILHAIDLASGTERWNWSPEHTPISWPAVSDGVLYIFDAAGTLFALDPSTGTERWHSASSISGASQMTIGPGALFAGGDDGALHALGLPGGEELWHYAVPNGGGLHIPAYADGMVYATDAGGGFIALDAASGKLVWHYDTGDDVTGTVVVADGIAYVGAVDAPPGSLTALDAKTGELLWADPELLWTPAVSDGVAYSAPGQAGDVVAHDEQTGAELWRFPVSGKARPGAVADGVVYIPAETAAGEHRIYALDAKGGTELWHFDVDGENDCCLAVAHGAVFVGTPLGGVYAIGGDGSTVSPGASPAAVASPAETLASPSAAASTPAPTGATGSPVAVTSPVEFVWSATGGGDGMNFPASVVLDPQGRLWVADAGNSRFAIFSPDGMFIKYWGSKGKGDGQFDLQYASGNPNGSIAFEPDGSFFVLDAANRRVQHFDKHRKFLASWGSFGTGPGQYNDAIGIAVDAQGLVHVLDDGRDVVETYDQAGKVLGSFAPHLAGPDSANSMALDAQGNVYISACCDAGNGVRKFDPKGTLLATIGAASTGPGRFLDSPGSMAFDDAGRMFVTDGPTGNDDKVLVFDADGNFLSSFASPGSGPGQLGFAWGIALDRQGNAYVVDAGGNRIEKFRLVPPLAPSAAASPAPTVAQNPSPATGSPAAAAPPVEFLWSATGGPDGMKFPNDMALDPEGRLWVADTGNSRFAIFDPDGAFVEYWGSRGKGDGEFQLEQDNGGFGAIAFAPDASFYVLDVGNKRVQHFGPDRAFLGAWGSFGTGPGQYGEPIGLAVGRDGTVYVLDDRRGVVERYGPDGTVLGAVNAYPGATAAAHEISGAAFTIDGNGDLYTSTTRPAAPSQVQRLDPNGTVLTTFGSAGNEPGQFSDQPSGAAVDAEGRLFVTQGPMGNGANVQVFGADGSYLAQWRVADGAGTSFEFPFGILLDGMGNVYVADAGANRVDKFALLPPLAPSATASPSPVALLPQGRYATAPLTQAQIRAAVIAAGYDPGPVQSSPTSTVFTLDFDSGRLNTYASNDGGPIERIWSGSYEVVDDNTLVARDAISTITYNYSLVGDVLTLRMDSDTLQDNGELAAQTAIYDTAPFTRVR